jgi:MerR family mercuric resistance operon transcriptional regulator
VTAGRPTGLTIGALAEACGVSVETVRYYERRGLLDQPPRPEAGYRQYGPSDVERLAFVRRAKDLGFTLSEIAELVRSSGTGQTLEILAAARAKLEALRRQETEVQRMQGLLGGLVSLCEDGQDQCLDLVVPIKVGPTPEPGL